jgi:nitroimidazol reductase NimA-like FMN-containing flavoprotein (pyridoxamine 5'-phosphate oxidase superfamily)
MGTFNMTRGEREAFLEDVHIGIVAVGAPDKGPLAVPLWYAYEPGGELWFVTGPDSRKAKLIAHARRVTLCAQDEAVPYKYVSVEGPVVDIRRADREADVRVLARRYLGDKAGDRYVDRNPDESASLRISMRPETWYAIDYGKRS